MKLLKDNRNLVIRALCLTAFAATLAAFAVPDAQAACSAWSTNKNPGQTATCSCGGYYGYSSLTSSAKKLSASKASTSYLVEVTAKSSPTYNPITAEGTTQTAYTMLDTSQNYHFCQIRVSNE